MLGVTRRGHRSRDGVDKGPRPVSESLDDLVGGLTPPRASGKTPNARDEGDQTAPPDPVARRISASTLGTVFSRWEQLVGPAVARHARPLRLEGGTLVVAVDQPPWATQMRALAPGVLALLTHETGERLDRLEVVVRPAR